MEEVTKNPLDSNSCLRPSKTHHSCKSRLGRGQRQSTKIQGCLLTLLVVFTTRGISGLSECSLN